MDGQPIALGARAFDLLITLVEQRHRVVSKSELMDQVWPGLVVEENNLQVQISALRRVLGAQAIATVPGRGYRFVMPEADPSSDALPADASPSAALPLAAAPAPGPAATPHNLLPERSRFIGRAQELAECRHLLRDAQMLSLVAIGGCGKTRMALKLAEQGLADHPDGVWFVDLAPLQDPSRVPLALGAAIGVVEQPGQPLIARLAQALAGRRVLVVLDNCEHVAAAAAALADTLLRASPQLRFIATSRVPLGLPGERVFALPPLGCPPPPAVASRQRPECYDAVRLFIDRLQWSLPDFRPDGYDSALAADICRRLDGIPLALELAAARARVLSLQEIHARLGDRFRLLKLAAPAQQRPQTLRSIIQWSYDQLTPQVQQLFRCLGVFAGGFTLPSLAAVVGEGIDEFEVLDELAALVDQSLVVVHQRPGGGSRYDLLETVRMFAQDQLQLAGEWAAVRTRHLLYMAGWVRAGFPRLQGSDQRAWLLQLDDERENLLLAHDWCSQVPEGVACGLELTACLQGYWRSRGIAELGYRVAQEALQRAVDDPPSPTYAEALFAAGDLAYFLGLYQDTQILLERSRAMAHALGERRQQALSQLMLGMAHLGDGDGDTALGHCQAALALIRPLGEPGALHPAVMGVGVVHMALRQLPAAAPYFDEALALTRAQGSPSQRCVSLVNCAWVDIDRDALATARDRLLEAAEIADDIRHESLGQMVVDTFVGWAAAQGQWEQAARLYGAAQASIDAMHQRRQPAIAAMVGPHLARLREALGATPFERLQAAGREMPLQAAVTTVRACLLPWRAGAEPAPQLLPSG